LTPPFFGVTCDAVGPNTFGDHGDLEFAPAVSAVGFDFQSNNPGTVFTLTLFGASGELGSTTVTSNGPSSPVFFGVQSGEAITRIESRATGDEGELFCNVEFGGGEPPTGDCELPSWVSIDPDSGSVGGGD